MTKSSLEVFTRSICRSPTTIQNAETEYQHKRLAFSVKLEYLSRVKWAKAHRIAFTPLINTEQSLSSQTAVKNHTEPPCIHCLFECPDLSDWHSYCLFTHFTDAKGKEVVTFFARGEVVAGLCTLATFVTGDFEVVVPPCGAGCSYIVTWPLRYQAQEKTKAILGGWDPSDKKFLKTD